MGNMNQLDIGHGSAFRARDAWRRGPPALLFVIAMLACGPLLAVTAAKPGAISGSPGLAAFARTHGFDACATELAALDANLFANAEYSLRAFVAASQPNTRPFSLQVDSRKAMGGGFARAFTNIVVTPPPAGAKSCAVMYEQTLYHDQRCDLVQPRMAPNATPSAATAFGAVSFELHRNMTLNLIPVGTGQCVSVLKEVSF